MTTQPHIELTDDLIERMVAERGALRMPADLVEAMLSAAVATPQRRASAFPRLWWPTVGPRARWVWVGIVLALLAFGAAIVGASIIRNRTTIGGGGLMVIAQVDQPGLGLTPGSMHLFGLDEVSGERAWSVDIPIEPGPCRPDYEQRESPPMLCGFLDGLPVGPDVGHGWGSSGWVKWSPDRKRVLLFDNRAVLQGMLDIGSHRLIPAPAGLNFANGVNQVDWAPTSDRIASLLFDPVDSRGITAGSVLVTDVGGHEIDRIALPRPDSATQPSWSPDGSAILLGGGRHVFIVPVDGSPVRMLLDEPSSIEDAAWSPDGSRIAYGTPMGIATLDVGTGRVRLLTHSMDGLDRHPTWSPDGRRIAFVGWDDLYPTAGYSPDAEWPPASSIFVVDVDGADRRRLTDGFRDEHPAWSPDGGSIVYGRFGARLPSVWVVGAEGGEPRLVFEGATADW